MMRLESIQVRVKIQIKRVKDYSYTKRLEELGKTTLLEKIMKGDLIETFKIINGISNYSRHFVTFLLVLKIYCQDRFPQLYLFFIYSPSHHRTSMAQGL